MATNTIPLTGTRTTLAESVNRLLTSGPTSQLHLGRVEAYSEERRHHTEVLGWYNLTEEAKMQAPILAVEFAALRTKYGTVSIRIFYPNSGEEYRKNGHAGALVYMHGGPSTPALHMPQGLTAEMDGCSSGGYTVGELTLLHMLGLLLYG